MERQGTSAELIVKRFVPVSIALAAAIAFFALGLQNHLSLDALRQHRAELQNLVEHHLVASCVGYIVTYAALVALSVPGGLVLTIAGGFLFGALAGTAKAVLGATAGATCVFLIAQTALGHLLQQRASGMIARLAEGFRRDAFSYLLVLRLVPLFPFCIVNLAPAIVGVPIRTFMLATLIGIIPGTFVYASVGAGLGSILDKEAELSLAHVMTPQILVTLLGLAALALTPTLYRMLKERRGTAKRRL